VRLLVVRRRLGQTPLGEHFGLVEVGLDEQGRQEEAADHPAADAEGYVLAPNVNTLIEAMDMRQAQRSYEANINVIDASKQMISRTIDILRN
jgi:flagellar basal-body rod protein FlgC